MNNELKRYFENLQDIYKDEVKLVETNIKTDNLDKVPKVLHSLYESISKAKLPFGEIFTIDEAIKKSRNKPFNPDWFVFGKDNYFSFWLCSFNKDEEGLSFTYWDHESGEDIDGAICEDIVSFLKEVQEEYEEYINS